MITLGSSIEQGRGMHSGKKGEGWRNVWAIKSCRVAKTPSEFYLSFEPSLRLTAIGRESPATSADFPSPSPSSGDQTLIGLDFAFLSLSFFPALSAFLENPCSLFPSSLFPAHFFFNCLPHFSSEGTLFLLLERTSAGHVSNRPPR